MSIRTFASMVLAFAASSVATASLFHDESINGDLSNNRLAPTAYALALGTNSLIATSVQGDREYVALTIPAGLSLSALLMMSYVGTDGVAFAGVQAGPQMTVDPDSFSPAGLLGWSHFGSFMFPNGTNFLPQMGTGFGADGFTPPLPAGTYTFWIQQAGTEPCTYQLDFVLTPAPGTVALFGMGWIASLRRRR